MAVLAVTLFTLAQPRMFCAAHCLILEHIGGDEAAASAPGQRLAADGMRAPPVADMACGHKDAILTSTPAIPVGSVGPATLAVLELPLFRTEPPEALPAPALRTPASVTFSVDPPPPRA